MSARVAPAMTAAMAPAIAEGTGARDAQAKPSQVPVVALVCGSRWSISESEVTVTYSRAIGFGMGQIR